jgi:hypothetical protein
MKIEIRFVKENEDGSADTAVWVDEEAKDLLIRKGIIAALTEAVEHSLENYTPKEENES